MTQEYDINGMVAKIRALKRNAAELKKISGGIQAVDRNADRILANVRMLEIDVVEPAKILSRD